MIAVEPTPHGINSSLGETSRRANLKTTVYRMPILRKVFTQMPMYPFNIKAQVGLISAHAMGGSMAKTSILLAILRSLLRVSLVMVTFVYRSNQFSLKGAQ